MSTDFPYFFVIFNIFTILLLYFYAICTTFSLEISGCRRRICFSVPHCFTVPHRFCSICSTFSFFAIFSTIATVSVMIFRSFAQFFHVFASCEFVFVPFLFHFPFQIQLLFLCRLHPVSVPVPYACTKKETPVCSEHLFLSVLLCFGNVFHMFPVCFFLRYFRLFGR